MLFCSREFVYFFLIVFVAYWALPWHRVRVWLLVVASVYFYASWNRYLALLVAASAGLDYCLARGMEWLRSERGRRALLAVSLVGNLGLLCYFKYANFFLESLTELLHAAGAGASLPVLSVLLPVGISFYTFEAINYTVDVYRRRMPAERNLGHFLLFILFFPHLVAGPIVRARDFLPQIRRHKRWTWQRCHVAAGYLVVGLVKKMVISDRMAAFADPVFAEPASYGTGATWVAVIAYAVQIYCDFSGYSDMALGTAHLLGYRLSLNFNMPYLAANFSDFWRRWHVSLSSWLRDYLFIPLGGSRGGEWKTCRNLLITMALGGLWHGARWNFVAWGVLHGLLLVTHRGFRALCRPRARLLSALESWFGTALRVAFTFLAVSLTWVFFRATTFATSVAVLKRLFRPGGGQPLPLPLTSFIILLILFVLGHVLGATDLGRRAVTRLPAPALGLGYAAAVTFALLLAPDASKVFIYFQF
jgi:alginate O-acetyltransferase complex protein AlgI